jgi:hypothetical protein
MDEEQIKELVKKQVEEELKKTVYQEDVFPNVIKQHHIDYTDATVDADAGTMTLGSDAQGDIWYRDSDGNIARLGPGTSGQYLQTQGASANPQWATVSSTNPGAVNFRATRGTNQSITQNTTVKVQFDTEAFDNGSNYDHSTNYNFTAPEDGEYFFGACVTLEGMTTGTDMRLDIYVGAGSVARGDRHAASQGNTTLYCATLCSLSQNDTVDARVTHGDSAARNTEALSTGNYFYGFQIN